MMDDTLPDSELGGRHPCEINKETSILWREECFDYPLLWRGLLVFVIL